MLKLVNGELNGHYKQESSRLLCYIDTENVMNWAKHCFVQVNISCLFCHNWEGHFSHACGADNNRLHFHTSTPPTDQCLISGPHIYVFLHFDLSEGANYRMTSAALFAAHRPLCRPRHYISNKESTGENAGLHEAPCFLTYWGWHIVYIYIIYSIYRQK